MGCQYNLHSGLDVHVGHSGTAHSIVWTSWFSDSRNALTGEVGGGGAPVRFKEKAGSQYRVVTTALTFATEMVDNISESQRPSCQFVT